MVEIGEEVLIAMVDQDSIHQVGEVIADRAVDRPVVGQVFTRLKNLLDQHIERGLLVHPVLLCEGAVNSFLDAVLGERRLVNGVRALAGGIEHLQPGEVLRRIQQSVGMIDAQARNETFAPAVCG